VILNASLNVQSIDLFATVNGLPGNRCDAGREFIYLSLRPLLLYDPVQTNLSRMAAVNFKLNVCFEPKNSPYKTVGRVLSLTLSGRGDDANQREASPLIVIL
jgi:hypothetical protein